MNKRWFFTHLLPILIGVLVIGAGTVYAVPSLRNKAVEIAKNTVGIFADIEQLPPSDQRETFSASSCLNPNPPAETTNLIGNYGGVDNGLGQNIAGRINVSPKVIQFDQIEDVVVTINSFVPPSLKDQDYSRCNCCETGHFSWGAGFGLINLEPISTEGITIYSSLNNGGTGWLEAPQCAGEIKYKVKQEELLALAQSSGNFNSGGDSNIDSSPLKWGQIKVEDPRGSRAFANIGIYYGPLSAELTADKEEYVINSETGKAEINISAKTINIPTKKEIPGLPVILNYDREKLEKLTAVKNDPSSPSGIIYISETNTNVKIISGQSYKFEVSKPGEYEIKYKPDDGCGTSEEKTLMIKVIGDISTPELSLCSKVTEETIPYVENEQTVTSKENKSLSFQKRLQFLTKPLANKFQDFLAKTPQVKAQENQSANQSKEACANVEQIYKNDQTKIVVSYTNPYEEPLKDLKLVAEIESDLLKTTKAGENVYWFSGLYFGSEWDLNTTLESGQITKYTLTTYLNEIKGKETVEREFTIKVTEDQADNLKIKAKAIKLIEGTASTQGSKPGHALAADTKTPQKEIIKESETKEITFGKLLTPKVELIDIKRKNEKGEMVSVPEDRLIDQKLRNEVEIYPGDQLVLKETIKNDSAQELKNAKLVLTLPKIKDLVATEGNTILDLVDNTSDSKSQDISWKLADITPDQEIIKNITVVLPKDISIDLKSLKLTPKLTVADDKKIKEGKTLEQDLWDWLEGTVTGHYGHPVPDAYITLVDKDNKDIEHTYYKEELTKTAQEKLGENEKTLGFTLTDETGGYKIKINKNKDFDQDDKIKIKLYLRDHQKQQETKLSFVYNGRDSKDFDGTGIELFLETEFLKPDFEGLNLPISRITDEIWAKPSADDEKMTYKSFGGDLKMVKGAVEVYYNIWQARKVYLETIGQQEAPSPIKLVSSYNTFALTETPAIFFDDRDLAILPPIRSPFVDWHEFGHLVDKHWAGMFADQKALEQKFPERHVCYNHNNYSNDCTTDSLIEGWAGAFADMMCEKTNRTAACKEDSFRFHPGIVVPAFANILFYNNNKDKLELFSSAPSSYPSFSRYDYSEENAVENLIWSLVHGINNPNTKNYAWTGGYDLSSPSLLSYKDVLNLLYKKEFISILDFYNELKNKYPGKNFDPIFILYGMFYDKNGNWKYDLGEDVGKTANQASFVKWWFSAGLDDITAYIIPSRPWRENRPYISGSYLNLSFYEANFISEKSHKNFVKMEFDSPYEYNNNESEYYVDSGKSYIEFLPFFPSKAYIYTEGDPNPLVIDSNDYWQMIASGMFDYIAEHDFYVDGGKPASASSEDKPPIGDSNGPASDQTASYNNLPENEKPIAEGEAEKQRNIETPVVEPSGFTTGQALDKVVDTVVPDPVFNVVTNIVSGIVDDINTVINFIGGRTSGDQGEININELIPTLSTCIESQLQLPLEFSVPQNQATPCRTDLVNLYQGDTLKTTVSFTNTTNQSLSNFKLSARLDYSKNIYEIDPKDGLKEEPFDNTQGGQENKETTISWNIDALKPGDTITKEFTIKVKENYYSNFAITTNLELANLSKKGETKTIFIGKTSTPKLELLSLERESQMISSADFPLGSKVLPGDNLNFRVSLDNPGAKSDLNADLIILSPAGSIFKTNEIHQDLVKEAAPEDLFGLELPANLSIFAMKIDSVTDEKDQPISSIEKYFTIQVPKEQKEPLSFPITSFSRFNAHFLKGEAQTFPVEILPEQSNIQESQPAQTSPTTPEEAQNIIEQIKTSIGDLINQVDWSRPLDWAEKNIPDIWNKFSDVLKSLFSLSGQQSSVPHALAAETPKVVAGPTISISPTTPSPVKAPITLVIDCKGFDKSKKIIVYLDNKEYKSSPILSKNFGIKVEIPKNAMIGTHTIKITGDNDQVATTTFRVSQNSWWNKLTVGTGLGGVIILIILIALIILIKRRTIIREGK